MNPRELKRCLTKDKKILNSKSPIVLMGEGGKVCEVAGYYQHTNGVIELVPQFLFEEERSYEPFDSRLNGEMSGNIIVGC